MLEVQKTRTALIATLVGSLLLFELALAAPIAPNNLKQLRELFGQGSGVAAVDIDSNEVLFSFNDTQPLKPASVQKVILSGALLKNFQLDHKFSTDIFAVRNGEIVKQLVVRGYGDPALRIEELWLLARKIKRIGIKQIGELIVDDAASQDPKSREGQRAYLAGSSALAFNYNSITFEVCPGEKGGRASVIADPFEFPVKLTGSIQTGGKGGGFSIDEESAKSSGEQMSFRLSGSLRGGCTEVYRTVSDPAIYFGVTLRNLLEQIGIKVGSGPRRGSVPEQAKKLFTHESKPIAEIIRDLNRYSNNFTAEQLVLLLGQSKGGALSRERGLQSVANYLSGLGFKSDEFSIIDGSGLSHDNRLSARILVRVLSDLGRDTIQGAEFVGSLPYPGGIGTLRNRSFDLPTGTVRAKTGTINGVSSLAGYLISQSNRRIAFAILQNGNGSKDRATDREERFLSILYRS